MYTYYVNPDKQCRCEIEEAMEYLLKLRERYFKEGGAETLVELPHLRNNLYALIIYSHADR